MTYVLPEAQQYWQIFLHTKTQRRTWEEPYVVSNLVQNDDVY